MTERRIKRRKDKKNMTKKKRLWFLLPALAALLIPSLAFASEEAAEYIPSAYATFWSLLPPVIAIALALITKEVYSSLFVGILTGALLYSGFGFEQTVTHMFSDGFISVLADEYNVGILIFLFHFKTCHILKCLLIITLCICVFCI